MATFNTDTHILSIDLRQLRILSNDGLALASMKGGVVLLNVKPEDGEPMWFALSPTLAAWLAEQLPLFTQ